MNAVGPMVWKNKIARSKYLQILSRVFKGRREGTQIKDKKKNGVEIDGNLVKHLETQVLSESVHLPLAASVHRPRHPSSLDLMSFPRYPLASL